MRTLDLSNYQEVDDYTVWPIDFAMGLTLEVPADRLKVPLPAPLVAVSPRPGTLLLNLTIFRFPLGTRGLTAPATEVVWNVHVAPDRRFAPTMPEMAMYTLRLGASSREFLDSAYATDAYPTFDEALNVELSTDIMAARVTDGRGNLIAEVRQAEGVEPTYTAETFYAQSFCLRDGILMGAGNLFTFETFYNQKGLATAGRLYPHPFFEGVDLTGVTKRSNYMQMWSRPGSLGCENHFLLRTIGAS